jgi:hypothetical protein
MAAACSKRFVQIVSALISLQYIYWAHSFGMQTIGKGEYGPPDVLVAQLRVLGLRDPNLQLLAGNNLTFGLMKNGCPILSLQAAFGRGTLIVNTSTHFDGYYISISDGAAAADPVRWVVEVLSTSSEGSGRWKAVGPFTWNPNSFEQVVYPTPLPRKKHLEMDLRPSWTWLLAEVGARAVSACGWLFYSLAGVLRWEKTAVMSVSGLYAVSAVILCFAAACLWEEGGWWSAAVAAEHWLMEAVIDIILAGVFCSFQQRLVVALIACAVLKIAAKVSSKSLAILIDCNCNVLMFTFFNSFG